MAGHDGGPGVQWHSAGQDALVALVAVAIVAGVGVFVAWGLDGRVPEAQPAGSKRRLPLQDEKGQPQDTPRKALRFQTLVSAPAAAQVANPHDHKGKLFCQGCHKGRGAALKMDPVALCRSCHKFHSGNHPVGVVQKEPADPGLPLGPNGEILCHSCHPAHDLGTHPKALRMGFTPLCLRCHTRH